MRSHLSAAAHAALVVAWSLAPSLVARTTPAAVATADALAGLPDDRARPDAQGRRPPRAPARSSEGRPPLEPPAGDEPLTFAPAQTVELTLPVTGTWGVLQGFGDESHVGYATYALDLVPAEDRAKARPLASRKALADFPCWGRDVLALAPGEVVWAHDGEVDHPPFWPGQREPGNFVIVRHGEDELTELRHLQRGSLAVKVGDRVTRGQLLGRCGNSGNAHTPHVHLGFLGRLTPLATRPMRLSHYLVLDEKGHWLPGDGTPRTGQLLQPAPAETAPPGPPRRPTTTPRGSIDTRQTQR